MNREDAIAKILKCLRLSKSANEHEAAAALRQAQKLMQMHDVSDTDVLVAEVGEARTRSGASTNPAAWEQGLAKLCADAFGCEMYFDAGCAWTREPGTYVFVGSDSRQVLCQYAFVVLLRQCRRARADYIKTKLRRCGPRNRTARADLFCAAWIYAVRKTVEDFAWTDQQRNAVAAWFATNGITLVSKKVAIRKVRGDGHADALAGLSAADGVRLDRPVGGEQREALQ